MRLPTCYNTALAVTAPSSVKWSPPPGLPPSPCGVRSLARQQTRLFCCCGTAELYAAGLCIRCCARQAHSRLRFAGHREAVLERDGHRCRACGSESQLAVHHRRPGIHQRRLLITLCAACHARVHRLRAMRPGSNRHSCPSGTSNTPTLPFNCSLTGVPLRERCCAGATTHCRHSATHGAGA
jgi:hypothetical protein